ncbi:hypothetical protein CDD81_6866 [Ophiocordyceps australis]|uniref:Uncharacterized protein n=1 Tax=Ophiocordyceps australis TaxID=1399860 RepID=A0A2C5Y5W8_9HYPO|nr:hypothetical protein CDD81_6866 [Ophiocordyceps australis]
MPSLSHSIAAADAIISLVNVESKRPQNHVCNEGEAQEAKAARTRTISLLDNVIGMVRDTLAKQECNREKLHKSNKPHEANSQSNQAETTDPVSRKHNGQGQVPDKIKALMTGFSADKTQGLGSQAPTLQQMAKGIKPIVDRFDGILRQPYLDHYSATLDTMPVMGLKNKMIVYLGVKMNSRAADATPSTRDEWTLFGSPPADADVSEESKVHLFPYKGDLCLSVGRRLEIGSSVLPAAELQSVIPFVALKGGNAMAYYLVVLERSGNLRFLANDDLGEGSAWESLSYKPSQGGPVSAPQWTRMAYWNNSMVAIDNKDNSWTLGVDFERKKSYSASDKTGIKRVLEFTATEVGPVAAHADGHLYRRFVKPCVGEQEPELEWRRWVAQDGVTRLGVASPGVILDLQSMTHSLKYRYLETQQALRPVMSMIRTFALAHGLRLKSLKEAAQDYQNATTEEQKRLAIKQGKAFIVFAKQWSERLDKTTQSVKEPVNSMTAQLADIDRKLAIQLINLQRKLEELRESVAQDDVLLSKLKAAFWVAVAMAVFSKTWGPPGRRQTSSSTDWVFLGFLAALITALIPGGAALAIRLGLSVAGGIVNTVILGQKISVLEDKIRGTEHEIRTTTRAIEDMSYIASNFGDLNRMYLLLNKFWGRMWNDASSLDMLNDITAELIGQEILDDVSSIVAADEVNAQIKQAAQVYLDVLNEQGVDALPSLGHGACANGKAWLGLRHKGMQDAVESETQYACRLFEGKDLAGFERHMDNATVCMMRRTAALHRDAMLSGAWYDLPSLKDTASIFDSNALQDVADVTAAQLRNKVQMAGRKIVQMLTETMATSQTVQELLKRYQELVQAGNDEGIAKLKETLLKEALEHTKSAYLLAEQAFRLFADVNYTATQYQQGLERQINYCNDEMARNNAAAQEQIDKIIGSGISSVPEIAAAQRLAIQHVQMQLITKNAPLLMRGIALNKQKKSGARFQENCLTWIEMVRLVSRNLGAVRDDLATIYDLVELDPVEYEELLKMQWKQLEQSTAVVLQILAAQGVSKALADIAARAHGPEHERVLEALYPPAQLDESVPSQTQGLANFFSNMDALLRLAQLPAIIGHWDQEKKQKATMLDIVIHLQVEHVDIVSRQYKLMQRMRTAAQRQKVGAQLVVEAKQSIEVFMRSTSSMAQSNQRDAQEAAASLAESNHQYHATLRLIRHNMDEIKNKIEQVNVDLEKLEQEQRRKIVEIMADIIALALATAQLLAGLGLADLVQEALSTAEQLGLGADMTSHLIKLVLDMMDLADLQKVIHRLKAIRADLQAALQALQSLEPQLESLVAAVVVIKRATEEKAASLVDMLNNTSQWNRVTLKTSDVAKIAEAWRGTEDACTQWLDAVNEQGINPAY